MNEQNIVATGIMTPEVLINVDIRPEHFTDSALGSIWRAMQGLKQENSLIEYGTVNEAVRKLTGQDYTVYLGKLCKDSILIRDEKTAIHYQEQLENARFRRDAKSIAQQMIDQVDDDPGAIDSCLQKMMNLFRVDEQKLFTIKECAKLAVDDLERAIESKGCVGIPYGIKLLDEATGGSHNGDLVILAARPAMGKTAVLLNMALNSNCPSAMISTEQGANQIGSRCTAIAGGSSVHNMRTGNIRQEEWNLINVAMQKLSDKPFWVLDSPTIDIGELQRTARILKHKHDIKILYVDYLQRINAVTKGLKDHEQVAEVTRGLKNLARELNIPVVALAQVSRDCEKRPDKRPGMADIAQSSIVEREADSIITLYRDEVYNKETQYQGIMEFIMCKNRHGPLGIIPAQWIGKCLQVKDMATGEMNNGF